MKSGKYFTCLCFSVCLVLGQDEIMFPDSERLTTTPTPSNWNQTSPRIGLGWKLLGVYLAAAAVSAIKATATPATTVSTAATGLPTFPTAIPTDSTGLPTFPTEATGLPTFPTDSPGLPTFPTGFGGLQQFPTSNPLSSLVTLSGQDTQHLLVYPQPPGSASLAQPQQSSSVACACVTAGTCVSTAGGIDIRIVTTPPTGVLCATGQQYCCIQVPITTSPPPTSATPTCGRQTNIPIPGVTVQSGQAAFGQYPWSALLLTVSTSQFVGGATLIGRQFVLTVAHNVANYPKGAGLKVRLGEWSIQSTAEPYRHVDIPVAGSVTHPQYAPTTLKNDIAILVLAAAVPFGATYPQIAPVCLPPANAVFTGQRCYVAGWGKDSFTGSLQSIMKQVDIPVLSSIDCQTRLRATRLGSTFVLDPASFLCAGGEFSKDACTGDGGSALVCPISTGQYVIAGLTSWGVGCATTGVPGVYTNVVNYLAWIAQQIAPTTTPTPSIDPRRTAG